MADQLQLRGGSTAEHSTFTGALREVTVDIDKDTVVVHDNATAGGHPLLREDLSNLPAGTIDNADINASAAISGTKIDPDFGSQTVETTGVFSAAGGAQATPSITFTGDLNTGIYSPGADQLAISTGGSGRLFVEDTGRVGIGAAVSSLAAAQSVFGIKQGDNTTKYQGLTIENSADKSQLAIAYDGTSGTFSYSASYGTGGSYKPLSFWTSNEERLRITSDGKVGVGTSTPDSPLQVIGNTPAHFRRTSAGFCNVLFSASSAQWSTGVHSDGYYAITHEGVGERLRIDSSGRVGIGTTSPARPLSVDSSQISARFTSSTADSQIEIVDTSGTVVFGSSSANAIVQTGGTERARIDSSGRLLVGTSSAHTLGSGQYSKLTVQGYTGSGGTEGAGYFNISRGLPATTPFSSASHLGGLYFTDSAGATFSSIESFADGVTGSGDYPGRLVFSTTADGASSPTERMRITQNGTILLGKSSINIAEAGFEYRDNAADQHITMTTTRANGGGECMALNRQSSDGVLISFYQNSTNEGSISVSGSTVSYNGGHLSRWSQTITPDEAALLLKGTVMTNLDEMCEWFNEDGTLENNEQLNKMAVSSVEGDSNVAGVLVNIDYDGDLNVAMTGDMVIRIAQGVTVQRGDLLMSAGDGTAKPQDDDIIRSKTIAKVTSTHVSETYADGSYCVPCVLMAC